MRIAYLIAAHKDAKQLERLINSLYVEDKTWFYVHIDKKSNIDDFSYLKNLPKTKILTQRINVMWGGFSQCKVQLQLFKECINDNIEFERIFMLSGLDYPLWSDKKIIDYLIINPDKELIMAYNLSKNGNAQQLQKVTRYHVRDLFKKQNYVTRVLIYLARKTSFLFPKKSYITNKDEKTDVFMGSSWFCLTYNCMKYVYDTITSTTRFINYFKYSFTPDEMMIHTIVFNSPYAEKAVYHSGDYPGLKNLTLLHYIEYTDKIATYCEKDFDKLIDSGKMFCRKIETGTSEELIRMIDEHRNKI